MINDSYVSSELASLDMTNPDIAYLERDDIVDEIFITESHTRAIFTHFEEYKMHQFRSFDTSLVRISSGFIMCFGAIELTADRRFRLSHVLPQQDIVDNHKNSIPNDVEKVVLIRTSSCYNNQFDHQHNVRRFQEYRRETLKGFSGMKIPVEVIEFKIPFGWDRFTIAYGDGHISIWDPVNKIVLQVFKFDDLLSGNF